MRHAVCFGLVALIALSGPVMAEPFHHPFGEWRQYHRDWLAVCPDRIDEQDDTGFYSTSCFASTGAGGDNDAGEPNFKLTLIRNRISGEIDLVFTPSPTDGRELDTTRPLVVEFGGAPAMVFSFESDLETRFNVENQYYVVSDDKLEPLLEAMQARNAAHLRIPITGGEADEVSLRFSMRGVRASLEFLEAFASAEP